MKSKLFMLFTAVFYMFSCNSDRVSAPDEDQVTGTYSSSDGSASDTISVPNIPDQPGNPEIYESRFTQLELDKIASLINLIPDIVKTDFEKKYIEWKNTWSRPEIAIHSDSRKYAESDEYENLLKYSQKYRNIILPLVFEKIAHDEFFAVNLLEDLTFPEYKYIYDDIESNLYRNVNVGNPLPSSLSIWIDYSKELLINM